MPTTRPRHVVTETDDLAQAIDRAERLYPGETRASLLRRLIELGAQAVEDQAGNHSQRVQRRAGRHGGVYERDELDRLRRDWPA